MACAFFAGPWARSEAQQQQYVVFAGLLVGGLALWVLTRATTRR